MWNNRKVIINQSQILTEAEEEIDTKKTTSSDQQLKLD